MTVIQNIDEDISVAIKVISNNTPVLGTRQGWRRL